MPVIGEGTYGCIHKPSLHCGDSGIDYDNKVSKILSNEEADGEMREFSSISKFDEKNEIFLGVPHRCSPAKTPRNIRYIKQCRNGKELVKQLQKYSLLVMEDGGLDLEKYGRRLRFREPEPTKINRKKIEMFWIEAHRSLIGLREFLKYGVVHHDLKNANIVYNEKNNRINFIDFGLMDTKVNLMNHANQNNYPFPIFHFNFPPELPFLDKKRFEKFAENFAEKSEEEKNEYLDHLIKYNKFDKNTVFDKTADTFQTMFSYYNQNAYGLYPGDYTEKYFYDGFKKTLVEYIKPSNYEIFLEKSLDTIDIYGTGIAFLFFLKQTKHLLESNVVALLSNLFLEMANPDLFSRIDINDLIYKYENILESTGLLSKHKKRFENNVLIEEREEIPEINLENIKLSPKEMKELTENEPKPTPGYKKSFSTRKTSLLHKTLKSPKKCPEGTVLNPKTNRCNKIKTKKNRNETKTTKMINLKRKHSSETITTNPILNLSSEIKTTKMDTRKRMQSPQLNHSNKTKKTRFGSIRNMLKPPKEDKCAIS